MTKSELVKAARTTSVRMGDADKLRAQQRQAVGPAAGALESWCPPNPRVPCHLCTGTLTAHAAGCPKAPKTRVQRLPAAAAPCGLVMDGDRLDAHRAQCGACQGGKQAASYAGIDRTTAPALLPYYLVASPCGYVGDSADSKKSHERVCRWCALTPDKAVPKTAKQPCNGECFKSTGAPGMYRACNECMRRLQTEGIRTPPILPAKCDRCGSAANVNLCSFDGRKVLWCKPCDLGAFTWNNRQGGAQADPFAPNVFQARPERLPPPAPIPWTGVDDWDLLPDA